jgi:hypothetical protein
MCPSFDRLLMTFFISITGYPWDDTLDVISSMCMPEPELAIVVTTGEGGGGRGGKRIDRGQFGVEVGM